MNRDVILYLFTFLSSDDIINFFNTCKDFYGYSKIYVFNEFYPYQKIMDKSYFDNFTAVNNYDEGRLPNNIKKLKYLFSDKLNDIKTKLPESIDFLEININVTDSLKAKLPSQLKELVLHNLIQEKLNFIFPSSLTSLKLRSSNIFYIYDTSPKSLCELDLKIIDWDSVYKMIYPKYLKKLRLFYSISVPDTPNFPPYLTSLDYNCKIKSQLPNTIVSLTLYGHNIDGHTCVFLPSNLKNLCIKEILCGFKGIYSDQHIINYTQICHYQNFIEQIPISVENIYVELLGVNFVSDLKFDRNIVGYEKNVENYMLGDNECQILSYSKIKNYQPKVLVHQVD